MHAVYVQRMHSLARWNPNKTGSGVRACVQVTRYLYATCENPLPGILQSSLSSEKWDVESNWMGFVAVAVDEKEIARLGRRDIVVSWRGTSRAMEWLVDAQIQLAPMTLAPDHKTPVTVLKPSVLKPKVEKGFWSLYTCKRSRSQFNQKSASEQVGSLLQPTSLLAFKNTLKHPTV